MSGGSGDVWLVCSGVCLLSGGCLGGVLEMSGVSSGVWGVSGECLGAAGGVWGMLGGVWGGVLGTFSDLGTLCPPPPGTYRNPEPRV